MVQAARDPRRSGTGGRPRRYRRSRVGEWRRAPDRTRRALCAVVA